MKAKILLLFLFLLCCGNMTNAQIVTLDETFGQNGFTVFSDVTKIEHIIFDNYGNIIATAVNTKGGNHYHSIIKTNANGIIEQSFGNNGMVTLLDFFNAAVFDIKITSENKILIIGDFYVISNGDRRRIMMQFDEDGTPDITFGSNGIITLCSISEFERGCVNFENDDYMLIGNIDFEMLTYPYISKYNYKGELDNSFGENGTVYLTDNETFRIAPACIKILNDQSIIVAGCNIPYYENYEISLCKLNATGNFVSNFAHNGLWKMKISHNFPFGEDFETFFDIIEDNNKNLMLIGIGCVDMKSLTFVSCFNPDGTINSNFGDDGFYLWNSFHIDPNSKVFLQKDNKLILGYYHIITSVNSNGTLNTGFNNSGFFTTDGYKFQTMKLQGEDYLILGGYTDESVSIRNACITRLKIPSEASIVTNNLYGDLVNIFPNPAKEYLNFDTEKYFEIFDIRGKLLLKTGNPVKSVNINHLNSGIYLIKFDDNRVIKFVKE